MLNYAHTGRQGRRPLHFIYRQNIIGGVSAFVSDTPPILLYIHLLHELVINTSERGIEIALLNTDDN